MTNTAPEINSCFFVEGGGEEALKLENKLFKLILKVIVGLKS
jgi:hypothetical protein